MQQRYAYILLGFLMIGHGCFAQSFSTKVSAKTIGKKDVVQVEYIAENLELQDMVLPVYSGWSILSGPNFSSNRFQTGNTITQQVVYTLTLQPQATGKLVIPGAKATIQNKTRLSNTVLVEVKEVEHVQGSQPSATTNMPLSIFDELAPGEDDINDDQVLKKGENARDKINNNLFVKLDVSKNAVYVGEPLLATYKLCTRIRSQSRVIKQPAFSGCTVFEMTADEPLPQKEKIGNKWYNVYIIRQVQLIPLQAGILDLPIASVENKVSFYREGQFSYRDLFYNNPAVKPEEQTVTFSNAPRQVTIKTLPQPGPASFGGAVGLFALSMNNNSNGGQTNNGNQLLLTVEGKGNLQQTRPPLINWPKGMEGFEPAEKENIDKTVFPAGVTKTFAYPYVASRSGSYIIPTVQFTYFNPAADKYITLTTKPLTLHVEKGTRKLLAAKKDDYTANFYNRLYLLLGASLLVVTGGLIWFSRGQKKPVLVTEHAVKPEVEAEKETTDTDQFVYQIRELEPGDDGPFFYRQLHRSLAAWLLGKYNITINQVDEYSAQHPPAAFALQKLAAVLNSCSLGMYTPMYNAEEAIQHRLTALEAISSLDKIS